MDRKLAIGLGVAAAIAAVGGIIYFTYRKKTTPPPASPTPTVSPTPTATPVVAPSTSGQSFGFYLGNPSAALASNYFFVF